MTKKGVSRRGFLKGIVQTVGAAGLATMFKFFPEAKGAFARRGPRLVNITTSSISSSRVRNLATRSQESDDTRKLLQFLRSRGGHLSSDANIQGRRTHVQLEDEDGNEHNLELDLVISPYLYAEGEREQKVMIIFSSGVSSDIENRQVPMLIVPQEGVFVVRDGEVVLHTDSSPLSELPSPNPLSNSDNSSKGLNQEVAGHLPTCCDHFWDCVYATGATLALFLLCVAWVIATPACIAALVADFAGIYACGLAYDCCLSYSCDCYH